MHCIYTMSEMHSVDVRRLDVGERALSAAAPRPDLRGSREQAGSQACRQQTVSHQTVHILFLANDRCLRDYDLVVAHC